MMNTAAKATLSIDQIQAIKLHEKWEDGRTGFLFCRVTACLTDAPDYINAEVVWMDNGDDLEIEDMDVRYSDPQLEAETNSLDADGGRERRDLDVIKLTIAEAVEIMEGDPALLLDRFRQTFAALEGSAQGPAKETT